MPVFLLIGWLSAPNPGLWGCHQEPNATPWITHSWETGCVPQHTHPPARASEGSPQWVLGQPSRLFQLQKELIRAEEQRKQQ